MEQVKTLDIVKERVKFVRQSTQHVVALRPMTIEFLAESFMVKYILQQNRIIHIVFDCRQMPTEEQINNMQPYLSIDNLDNVHIVTPDIDKKCVQVWQWKDLAYKILTKDADKEVLKDVKSEENNLQNKSRRNKTLKRECDKVCNHRGDDGLCIMPSPRVDKDTCKCDDYSPIM